ncbi:MAG: 50S ribosomal protein L6 [Endomicrobiales bacterium]|jgi:large subunit ribosomal protein L6
MSRLGSKPLQIPDKVKVNFANAMLEVQGPLGSLKQPVDHRLTVKVNKDNVIVEALGTTREHNMLHGLIRGLVKNAFEGVSTGFKKDLEIQGLGFKAALDGKNIVMSLGYSHPVVFTIPDGIKVSIEKQTLLSISGVNKELVGEVAARIRSQKKPEPYKGTGIRYVGEHIVRKVGKAAAGSAGGAKK